MALSTKSIRIAIIGALVLVLVAGIAIVSSQQAASHNVACDHVEQVSPGKVAHIHPIPQGVKSAVLCKYDGFTKAEYKIASLLVPQPAKLAHLINQSPVAKDVFFCAMASKVNYLVLFTLKSGEVVPFEFGHCGPASSPYSSHYFDLTKEAAAKLTQLENQITN